MTGQGEALGMAEFDGRWYIAPSHVRIQGGGWTQERVPVDGFELDDPTATNAVLRNDRFQLTVFRRPEPGARPPIALTATWDGQPNPVVLTELPRTLNCRVRARRAHPQLVRPQLMSRLRPLPPAKRLFFSSAKLSSRPLSVPITWWPPFSQRPHSGPPD